MFVLLLCIFLLWKYASCRQNHYVCLKLKRSIASTKLLGIYMYVFMKHKFRVEKIKIRVHFEVGHMLKDMIFYQTHQIEQPHDATYNYLYWYS